MSNVENQILNYFWCYVEKRFFPRTYDIEGNLVERFNTREWTFSFMLNEYNGNIELIVRSIYGLQSDIEYNKECVVDLKSQLEYYHDSIEVDTEIILDIKRGKNKFKKWYDFYIPVFAG